MDIVELKTELLNRKLRSSYIFIGEELALQDIYVDKIVEISGLEKITLDSLKLVYNKLGARTIVKKQPKVYVIRDDEPYYRDEKVWQKVIEGKNQGENIIILKYTNIDKRGKFYKEHEPILTEFNYIGSSLLSNRVQALTKWPIEYCRDLVRVCGCNYGRILHEIEKMQLLARVNNYSMNTAYLDMKKANMIHEEVGDIIFDFSNAVITRNSKQAYSLYEKLKGTDEGPIKLLSVLYNSFRNILLVQSTLPQERTEDILGLSKAQIYVTAQLCGKYSIYEVVDIVKLIQKIESGIKTGLVDQEFAMEYLMGEIL